MLRTPTALLALAVGAAGHGMIIFPKSRNANDAARLGAGACNNYIDYNPPFTNKSVGYRETGSGQPCLWFSQGCTIGCTLCDNHTQHTMGRSLCAVAPSKPPGPKPTCALAKKDQNFNGGDLKCGGRLCPQHTASPAACCELCGSKASETEPKGNCSAWTWLAGKCFLKSVYRGTPTTQAGCVSGTVTGRGAPTPPGKSPMEPTNNDPMTRTMNRGAVVGSVNDTYRYHPWRAPGFAPVSDACGLAGGRHATDPGGGDAVFTSIPAIPPNGPIKIGDLGSAVLRKGPSMATWKIGATVEVSWGIRFNHGGGYQYRLCPAADTLSETCFQQMPLAFGGCPILRWNNGSELALNATYVSQGTSPKGSTWAMNPIPRIDFDSHSSGQPASFTGCSHMTGLACRQFEPPCHEQTWGNGMPWHGTSGAHSTNDVDVQGDCSGDLTAATIVDRVVLPADVPPGDYVLGFRWDCEETAQIWSSCSDVTLTK